MDRNGENARGLHALRVLEGKTDFTLQGLIDAAYDSYLPAFEEMILPLLMAYGGMPASDPLAIRLAEPMSVLRGWDYRFGVESVATSVAIFWGNALRARDDRDTARGRLEALVDATDRLTEDFGDWRTPWGEINRFQRLTGDIVQPFDDSQPSIPWASRPPLGAPSPHTDNGRSTTPRRSMAPGATASWPWWSSATACARGPSRRVDRTVTPPLPTSTTKPNATRLGISGRSTSTVRMWRRTGSGSTDRAADPSRRLVDRRLGQSRSASPRTFLTPLVFP